jgi:hypothetical protein
MAPLYQMVSNGPAFKERGADGTGRGRCFGLLAAQLASTDAPAVPRPVVIRCDRLLKKSVSVT